MPSPWRKWLIYIAGSSPPSCTRPTDVQPEEVGNRARACEGVPQCRSGRAGRDKSRCGFQHVGARAEQIECRLRFRNQLIEAISRRRRAEHSDERRLVSGCILACRFPDCGRIALNVEKIVRDLERLAQSRAVAVESIPP